MFVAYKYDCFLLIAHGKQVKIKKSLLKQPAYFHPE